MLSVALLGGEPGERIVDMCASPGSKASEIADRLGERGLGAPRRYPCKIRHLPPGLLLQFRGNQPALTGCDRKRWGAVLANDNDVKRCWMLMVRALLFAH